MLSLVVVGSYYAYDNRAILLASLGKETPRVTNVLGVSMERNESLLRVEKTTPEDLVSKKDSLEVEEKKTEPLEKIALVPIIPVIDMEREERISEQKSKRATPMVAAKPNTYLTPKELAAIAKTQKIQEAPPRKTKKITFTSSSANYIETMKAKFLKSNSPRDALLLAKAYYKKSQYVEAEKWAFSANKLDNNLEESWLLFAKSKAKQGKKREALKILSSYYKKSHSTKAKTIMRQIEIGKI